MKKMLLVLLVLSSFQVIGQKKVLKKPEYVIVANDKIITKAQLEALGNRGFIKGMNKGVTEAERNRLAKKLGDKIGDREFIITVDILTEKEKLLREKRAKTTPVSKTKRKEIDEMKVHINDVARDFTVQMIDGKKITLSKLKGKVVLLNFWATWCAPCLMEFTEIPKKILAPLKDEAFVFVPISIGEGEKKVANKMEKMKKYGVHFNVGFDPKAFIWNQYATGAIPKSILIDKKGVIRYISIGNSEGNIDRIAAELKKLLAQRP